MSALADKAAFKSEREALWAANVDYWLRGPLRHVVDVGDRIVDRTERLCSLSGRERPIVVDMGFGDGWLLRALLRRQVPCQYIGLDCTVPFVDHAREEFRGIDHVNFEIVDFENPYEQAFNADIVVNSFNFLELCELTRPFENAQKFLRLGGVLQMATIDKTYLILALSNSWEDFRNNLARYQSVRGVKYAFQQIDLGTSVSETLFYPSVLYSTEDYLSAARSCGLNLTKYTEHVFTGTIVPKIYCMYEFQKAPSATGEGGR